MERPIYHCYPLGDLREHETDGAPCWCRPRIEHELNADLVIHNSLDGREAYETGERKLH